MSISVVAIKPGFYDYYRVKGEQFNIRSLADLGDWMAESPDVPYDGGSSVGVAVIPHEEIVPIIPVAYSKEHTGSGNFVVLDFLGNQIGPVIARQADPSAAGIIAQGYVDRLNAGAAPDQVFP